MSPTINVSLLTPEKRLFSGLATFVSLRSGGGDIAFLANHAPFIGTIEICVVKIELLDAPALFAAVHGGFVNVARNEVVILASVAELSTNIDIERVQRALLRANQALMSLPGDINAEKAVHRAEVRLDAAALIARTRVS